MPKQAMMPLPTRLDKYLSQMLDCSRAQARQYIEGGWVSVDGIVVEQPQCMIEAQQVTLAPDARPGDIEPATILLHKPAGIDSTAAIALLTAEARSELDASGMRMLGRHLQRLETPLALEAASSGLLVLSQDPRALRRLTEDGATLEQEYVVEVEGDDLPPYGLSQLARGLQDEGRALPPCKVSWQSERRLRFAIKDVRPGQLQRMCAQVGLQVTAIRRLRIGRIGLAKMPPGQWRYLPGDTRF